MDRDPQPEPVAPRPPTVRTAPSVGDDALTPGERQVVRSFFSDDRLTTIPSRVSKRLVVLRYLRDRCFTEDRDYPEKEINQRLALFHPDVATLRRDMVDHGLMTRDAGVYRRPPNEAPGEPADPDRE